VRETSEARQSFRRPRFMHFAGKREVVFQAARIWRRCLKVLRL
jgi:hypothetical protein